MGIVSLAKIKIKSLVRKVLEKYSNKDTFFSSRYLTNNQLRCSWNLSSKDKLNFISNENHRLCLRIYDISNGRSISSMPCIMKEVELKTYTNNEFCFAPPVANGTLLIEFGYRQSYSEWFLLASSKLFLGKRDISAHYPDESWLYSTFTANNLDNSIHEKVYQLSLSGLNGGSEEIHR